MKPLFISSEKLSDHLMLTVSRWDEALAVARIVLGENSAESPPTIA